MSVIQSSASKRTIDSDEIEFLPASYADPNGRLFTWKGGLFRAISSSRISLYEEMFASGLVQRLVERNLIVHTELSDFVIEGYGLVLQHARIPFVAYPWEWCGPMLKDAALQVLDLMIELEEHGLALQDMHPFNVLFDGVQPLFTDFCSIIPVAESRLHWTYDEFCRWFLFPLYLHEAAHGRIARRMMLFDKYGILLPEFKKLAPVGYLKTRYWEHLAAWRSKSDDAWIPASFFPGSSEIGAATLTNSAQRTEFWRCLREQVGRIGFPETTTKWGSYLDGAFPDLKPSAEWTAKQQSAYDVLSEIRPETVLDWGSNRGWFSQLATTLGCLVVGTDDDEKGIGLLHRDAVDKRMRILPLIISFHRPSPGIGICNRTYAPATERLSCEMVLAVAIVHHLFFTNQLTLEMIVDQLAASTKRWLFVEFIPKEDVHVSQWSSPRLDEYNLANFRKILSRHFSVTREMASYPEPRVFLLCEKLHGTNLNR